MQSVENLIRLRASNPGRAPARRRASPDTSAVRSVRAAVLELKVQLDVAREALASEREVQSNLLQTIESLAAQQRAGLDNASRLDRIADGYSTALGHLIQMNPEDVQTRS
jgi:ribosome-binding protein aMBF1 (putative translation factor)